MPETFNLSAVSAQNAALAVKIEVPDPSAAILRMAVNDGTVQEFHAGNLFSCLMLARATLEESGFILCCQGARPNVFPSGMLQQTDNGRYAYVLTDGQRSSNMSIVDIFAPAEFADVVTVAEQRATIMTFFGLEKGSSPTE